MTKATETATAEAKETTTATAFATTMTALAAAVVAVAHRATLTSSVRALVDAAHTHLVRAPVRMFCHDVLWSGQSTGDICASLTAHHHAAFWASSAGECHGIIDAAIARYCTILYVIVYGLLVVHLCKVLASSLGTACTFVVASLKHSTLATLEWSRAKVTTMLTTSSTDQPPNTSTTNTK
jgi:hypothetical protein